MDKQPVHKLIAQTRLFADDFLLIGNTTAKAIRDVLTESLERVESLEAQLWVIQDFAHERSRGPTIADDLWEVRRMAQELI